MRPTVKIAFDLSLAGGGDFFTLNDPVKGQLDDAPFGLAGDVLTDVSDDVRLVTVRRGRSNETLDIDAGTANVVLDNRLRTYDPTAAASVSLLGPSILPRKEITIGIDGESLFRGQVEDWDLQYAISGDSVTTAKCADGFTLLSQQVFASGPGATGLAGSVIYQTASAAGFPLGRITFDPGNATIGANTIADNTNVLQYLQLIAGSEPGLLFIGKDGTLTFRDRTASQAPTGVEFTDDGTGIPFTNIEIDFGTELLNTRVEVEWTGGKVSAENTASIVDYGVTTLALKTLLGIEQEAEDLATFLVQRYGEPVLRIVGLRCEMNGLPPADQLSLLALELGDGVKIRYTPNGIGDPVERTVVVDSIQHDMTPGSHFVSFNFSQTLASLILDDLEQGILDENTLGF
jgi:hypothetical protein